MVLADFHVHSDNSPDGSNSVIELCESAIKKDFSYIALTDHCEIDSFYKDRYNIGYRQSFFEAKKAASIFEMQVTVFAGVELGQATSDIATAESVLLLPYDVVLGSIHALPGMQDFCYLDYENVDVKKLFTDYLKEILKLVNWGKFDSLSHLTYPLRYINGEHGYNLDTKEFGDEIEKILRGLIKRGLALEVNTSGLRQPINSTMPDLFCLELYRSLGGELITLGSDAHRSDDLGAGIKETIKLLQKAGFSKYCIYKARKPQFIEFAR